MTGIRDLRQGLATAGRDSHNAGDGPRTSVVALMVFEAATLAVVSPLHLAGVIGDGTKLNPAAAGVAEAVIGAVLALAALNAWRKPAEARWLPVAAVCFAVLGFGYGLSLTARGGDAFDVAYHSVLLPVLIVTLILLLRPGAAKTPA